MVSTLTTRISRLKAIDTASDGAFESCALSENYNNISGHHRRFGAAWRLVEDDHMRLTMSINVISMPNNSDVVILDDVWVA